jgi:hypothetical protein
MIEPAKPTSWKNLQRICAQILSECGLITEVEKKVTTARGAAVIDVYAVDPKATMPTACIIECKYWRRPVPQSVAHSVRTVVVDYGASHGFIISSRGFQKGAYEATVFTNVKLWSYQQFEEFFEAIWTDAYLRPELFRAVDPLIVYTEPINSRVFRKADNLSPARQARFRELRKAHVGLAMTAMLLSMRVAVPFAHETALAAAVTGALRLPFSLTGDEPHLANLPEPIKTEVSARRFLELYRDYATAAIAEFDEVFGERA